MSEHGRIFANPHAGPKSVSLDELRTLFADHAVDESDPEQLERQVVEALRDASTTFVGVAGGDGSVRCVAETVVQSASSTPVLVVPAGTRNHFARDIGLTDLDAAADAARESSVRAVDVGWVNGSVFVNNSSIGVYPNVVAEREEHERRLPKKLANVIAAWHQFRAGHRLAVDVDGSREIVWAVFVGNDCYGETLLDLVGRDHLDEGVLDVRVLRAEGRFSRLRIAGAVLFGRLSRSQLIEVHKCSSITLDTGGDVDVALDGEVVTLRSPLEYRSCPGALRVLVRTEDHDDDDDQQG